MAKLSGRARCDATIRVGAALIWILILAACGADSPVAPAAVAPQTSAPVSPTPPTPAPSDPTPPVNPVPPDPPTAAETFHVRGRVTDDRGALASAVVSIVKGTSVGLRATTNSDGRYELASLPSGEYTLEATAPEHLARRATVHLEADGTADFALPLESATPAPPTPAPSTVVASGRVIDVLSEAGLAGVSVEGQGLEGESDATGTFQLSATQPSSGIAPVTVTGRAVVSRQLPLNVPAQGVVISLIPSAFDLNAFDQMFRSPVLRRWVSAPPLVVEQRVVQFTSVDMGEGAATADVIPDEDTEGLVADLTWALPQLTGGHFTSFASVTRRTTAADGPVMLLNPGVVTVVRVAGLSAGTGTWGWSRWYFADDGTVLAGLMMLDSEFDATPGSQRRSLRAHELGHALGYDHVTTRASVMNPEARLEPTAFDRDASRIAFARLPGNRAPDVDPEARATPQGSRTGRWSAPVR